MWCPLDHTKEPASNYTFIVSFITPKKLSTVQKLLEPVHKIDIFDSMCYLEF